MASIGKAMAPFLAAAVVVALVMGVALWTPPDTAVSPVAAQTDGAATPTPTPPPNTPVAEAFRPLDGKLVRVFHFDNANKNWLWYDPEVPNESSLAQMETGKSYWIRVTETVREVQLNGRPRDLTCNAARTNCWNLLGW